MKNLRLILVSLVSIIGCSEDEPASDDATSVTFRQYADEVIDFSSEFTTDWWSASRVLGTENVYPRYGDIEDAWTQGNENRQYLVVGFDTLQTVSTIEIYETNYPGAIDTVYIRNAATSDWEIVYSGAPTDLSQQRVARIFTLDIPETDYNVDAVRIAIDYPFYWELYHNSSYPYVEIDAIAINGHLQECLAPVVWQRTSVKLSLFEVINKKRECTCILFQFQVALSDRISNQFIEDLKRLSALSTNK